jgi:serine/threonine-protein kinase RsbW
MLLTEPVHMQSDATKISIDSKVENIAIIEKAIDDICAKTNVDEEYYGNILIAVTEAVNNAIMHGNKENPDKKVTVEFSVGPKGLICKIADEGPGFDYANVPDPTSPENIEKPNGRGVFLMRHLADEISFHDNGAIVELNFNHIN